MSPRYELGAYVSVEADDEEQARWVAAAALENLSGGELIAYLDESSAEDDVPIGGTKPPLEPQSIRVDQDTPRLVVRHAHDCDCRRQPDGTWGLDPACERVEWGEEGEPFEYGQTRPLPSPGFEPAEPHLT